MSTDTRTKNKAATRELALFLVMLFIGMVILPALIYFIGRSPFGEYGGTGFSDFYGSLHGKFRSGEPVVWFLMLSPYIAWQLLRLTLHGFRYTGRSG
jgi:hypothetical protein